ncbi:MAG: type II toxin-antitoxin system HipA family toxin [Saccharospirillaceae bacterium]|nr:type II toxin-antitoxin system HipA family toxin [Pseudomonadales bacterium]NRB79756.1 type II toxin-antitoxin system HipA family toxin [Saccharospirillaceae bacterium]
MAKIDVYLKSELVGRLEKTGQQYVFSYHHNAISALSLTMPLRTQSYTNESLHPIFQMNLPEGHLRQVIERATAKQYGSDDLTMLAILGDHQIGQLGFAIEGQPLLLSKQNKPDLKALLGSEDANLFDQLLKNFACFSGVAGVQPKVLLEINDSNQRLTLPLKSYIVKSWGDDYPHLACNEFVCLSLAKLAGLEVSPFYLSDNAKLLITERFDLNRTQQRLGFEDFAVLQAKSTKQKYDASLESCANTIKQYVSAEFKSKALHDFFKLTIINYLVGNGDAHLKNSGILYDNLDGYQLGQLPKCKRRFAPIFDIVSTQAYLPNDMMALSLTGSKRWPKFKVLEKFAITHCDLSKKQIKKICDDIEIAAQEVWPILEKLENTHPEFIQISVKIKELISRKIN